MKLVFVTVTLKTLQNSLEVGVKEGRDAKSEGLEWVVWEEGMDTQMLRIVLKKFPPNC